MFGYKDRGLSPHCDISRGGRQLRCRLAKYPDQPETPHRVKRRAILPRGKRRGSKRRYIPVTAGEKSESPGVERRPVTRRMLGPGGNRSREVAIPNALCVWEKQTVAKACWAGLRCVASDQVNLG